MRVRVVKSQRTLIKLIDGENDIAVESNIDYEIIIVVKVRPVDMSSIVCNVMAR